MDTLSLKGRNIHICSGQEELATAAARKFADIAAESIKQRGRFVVAISGGSSPPLLYARLLKDDIRGSIEWDKIHFFVGDERCVAADSDENNFNLARRHLFSKLNLPEANLHPTVGQDKDPENAAADYERLLRDFFVTGPGKVPQFDLNMLGMGPDGHCASLFPGTAALEIKDKLVVANHVEKLNAYRITFTYPLINNSLNIFFLIEGEGKSEVLAQVLESDALTYPCQSIKPTSGDFDWFVDRAAARDLCSLPKSK